jgi:hypothetical protein
MEPENGEISEISGEDASTGGPGSARALVIGAFAAGVLAGGALVLGLLILGRTPMGRLEKAERPRRFRIGNLEIEERGDDKRFHVK